MVIVVVLFVIFPQRLNNFLRQNHSTMHTRVYVRPANMPIAVSIFQSRFIFD